MTRRYTKALLIDDDKINNYLSEEIITTANLSEEVIVLTDGMQGLEYVKGSGLTAEDRLLILLDLNMPIMDGFEFLERFKTLEPPYEFLIIILTSSDNQRDKESIAKYNIQHFISKPITEEKLLTILS